MKVTIIGTGYVGLVTGACLAEMGNHVVCVDTDAEKIRILESGGMPIHEPGLLEMVARNRTAQRLQFTTDAVAAVNHGTLQFIGVGTPPEEDGSADLQYVLAAARNVGRHMTDYKVIIDKSTVPVGTGERVHAAVTDELAQRGLSVPFAVVSNPEFLKEGAALEDFMRPDRIIVGADDERAVLLMRALYATFTRNHDRLREPALMQSLGVEYIGIGRRSPAARHHRRSGCKKARHLGRAFSTYNSRSFSSANDADVP